MKNELFLSDGRGFLFELGQRISQRCGCPQSAPLEMWKKPFPSVRKSLGQVGDSCCLPPLHFHQGSRLLGAMKSLSPGSPSPGPARLGPFTHLECFIPGGSSTAAPLLLFGVSIPCVCSALTQDQCSASHRYSTACPWRLFSIKSIKREGKGRLKTLQVQNPAG